MRVQDQKLFRFGRALTELRLRRGISQKVLAARAGLDASRLSGLENARLHGPNRDTAERLTDVLAAPERVHPSLVDLAARDRVMHLAVRELPLTAHSLIAAALDAAQVLSERETQEFARALGQAVQLRQRLQALTSSQEATMT